MYIYIIYYYLKINRRLPKVTRSCGRLWEVTEGFGRLRDIPNLEILDSDSSLVTGGYGRLRDTQILEILHSDSSLVTGGYGSFTLRYAKFPGM